MEFPIRPVSSSDHAEWLLLWNDYLAFYNEGIAPATTANTWKKFHNPGGHDCLVAIEASSLKVIGFVTYLFHPSTWTDTGYCYLEDLFVAELFRKSGAGTSLIKAVAGVARQRKVSRVYWYTDDANEVAKNLYRKVGQQSDSVQFRIATR
ncbi:GNAT family N-acetyltransferase [Planctomycetes bacterium K23_9]|uniref:Acetyltransferase (GNAT) family protein n=1 Tax=Stieleria marina TaxID=1930275 RepID=A0A517NS36_9BACT|nr:Acetyltransferase (GNAT) family protein [Planctomycetes bacterium K23_9]